MEEVTYTTEITNVGNAAKYFEIDGCPRGLKPRPQAATSPPTARWRSPSLRQKRCPSDTSKFDARLKGGLPCGNASSGGFCYAERFTLGVDIFATPPELEVDGRQYEYIMPLVTKAYINNAASTDDDDIVMAYIDGELRGYSNSRPFPSQARTSPLSLSSMTQRT